MPIKRKRGRSRNVKVSQEAIARWREIRPAGIEAQGRCGMLIDERLSEMLGIPALLWLLEVREAYDQLEGNV
jgi:hypothetical protein